MRLQPLKQWICDSCYEVIKGAGHGYLEWLTEDDFKAHGFRIVHHAPHSPRRPDGNCYAYSEDRRRWMTMPLRIFVGPEGVPALLMFLDPGPRHEPDYRGPKVRDVREWVELFRRVQLPYYEEARCYWHRALADNFFDGDNEMAIYASDTLRQVVERYARSPRRLAGSLRTSDPIVGQDRRRRRTTVV